MKTFIKMNLAVAGFTAGQKWSYDKAPDVVKMWAKLPGVLGEELICSYVDEKGQVIADFKPESMEQRTKNLSTCKGVKADGAPCKSRTVRDSDYCRHHVGCAPQDETG